MYQVSPGVNISEIDLTTIVPGVTTSAGAIAGVFNWGPVDSRVLVDTESTLVSRFGKPTSNNPETFFTAANFLSYASPLYVVRAANTTDSVNGALNAIANTDVAIVVASVVLNTTDYLNNKDGNFSANVLFVARYPGAMGNSLRVSICSNTSSYSSNLNLYGTSNGNTINGSAALSVGSNTATFQFISSSDVVQANTYANTIAAGITAGDLIKIGNASIGIQMMKVSNVGTVSANSTVATFALGFENLYKLSTNYVLSNTVNGNTSVINVNRNWEYSGSVGNAPTTSQYVTSYGNSAAVDTMHIVVVDQDGAITSSPGSILEVYENVSRATDAKSVDGASIYYKTVINNGSRYIWWANDRSTAVSNTAANIVSSTNNLPLRLDFVGGQDGYTETTIPVGSLATGYDLFNSAENVDVSLILQGKPRGGTTTVGGQTVSNFQLANYLIDNIAETRKDCLVFVSPDDAIVKANAGQEFFSIVNWFGALRDSNYAVRDSGYKYMYDRYNDVYRYVPQNGDVAGLCARTEATNDSWWSPAGFNRGQIKNIVRLRYNPTKADRDVLYKSAINPIVTFPGQGTILFGDKTGTVKPSAFDRINVRRLFITLEKAISQVSKYSLFEFNDDFTRSQFRNLITPYLRDVQARRGITDFLVVCDATNNTADRIDRNEFWGDIYIKPNRSINFIQLNFVAVRTGVQFSTIIGQF
jgi:phage tail sheath protein FI